MSFKETENEVIYDGENYKKLFSFPVFYQGWEMDEVGYVLLIKNQPSLQITSHGNFNFNQNHVKDLKAMIKEWKNAIQQAEKALEMVGAHV